MAGGIACGEGKVDPGVGIGEAREDDGGSERGGDEPAPSTET